MREYSTRYTKETETTTRDLKAVSLSVYISSFLIVRRDIDQDKRHGK